MKLNQLVDNAGARRKARPLGRGIGSGRGKTSSRGGKGQTARSGVRLKGFQGGQMPLSRRLPKRGFTNIHRIETGEVNLGALQVAIEIGRIDPSLPITLDVLRAAHLFKKKYRRVRILAHGHDLLTHKLKIEVYGMSQKALETVKSKGGEVKILSETSQTDSGMVD